MLVVKPENVVDGTSDNTHVDSRTRSVVKYVINNIMSTALIGRR